MTTTIQRPVNDFMDGDILSLSLPFNGEFSREPEGPRRPQDISITEDELFVQNPTDHQWRSQYLGGMPQFLARYFGDRYSNLYQSKGRRHANTFLRTTVGENVLPRLQMVNRQYQPVIKAPGFLPWPFADDLERLPSFGRDELRNLSHRVADFMSESFTDYIERNFTGQSSDPTELWKRTQRAYRCLVGLCKQVGTEPPYWREFTSSRKTINPRKIESGLLRMMAPDWWRVRLKRQRDVRREHMAIAVGQVQKSASAYVSRSTMAEWVEQKRRNREFFKAFELENQDGERVSLEDMVNGSNANPAIRRCELMVRMRGFEDLANEMGCVGEFYTITAPSKYHAVYHGGGFVTNWNGASPRQTQKYLCSVWAKARAAIARAGINVFGFRVVEPHHDGTPHWHVLLFMLPQHVDQVRDILCYYARLEDSETLQSPEALKARFHAEPIDPAKGSATGYIAKYISKNIDGYALDEEEDGETGGNARDMAKAVTAWASRWRIRQFQQIGGAPVTVWRELRRLPGDGQILPDLDMDNVRFAADVGNWYAYTEFQGGPMVSRDCLTVRLSYEITEMGNVYAEDVKRVLGIYSPLLGEDSAVCTRLVKWQIVPKLAESAAQAGGLAFSGGNAAARSSVNNCTPESRQRLTQELRSRGLIGDEHEIAILERGSSLKVYGDRSVRLNNGRLEEVAPRPEHQRWPGWN
ncbi:replication endonuclease [Yersinia kristensenii]|uniref:replication endonuclease n=1 Tax=Yersinia kristensenii TaxID=28152 RepID=UPI0011A77466|nr:replication endonuclease [Yersinia kristensenii]